ncbi:HPr kinase/phosphorylase [Methylocapsa aurea]|uniref:HPr kinase/phosphorylase n=1 Tax=Methylocapsa aurea TaxID=663610 RepID=UPI000A071AF3|nr:HPr kinase/phosphatase C-terminal domain-containing protein [Methylocapsa aurea]
MNPRATQETPGAGPSQGQDQIFVHASAVAIKEVGVLIRGASGAGKSSLALALIAAATNAGFFARLIGDDRIGLEHRGGRLIARGHPAILGKIERRGLGIFELPFLAAAVIRLVADLEPADAAPPRYPEPERSRVALAGVSLPLVRLPHGAAASDSALSVLQLFHSGWKSL